MATAKLRPWVFMAEFWFDQIDRRGIDYFLDGWEDAGYEAVMFGRLHLRDEGQLYPSFAPDHSLYRDTALQPPELPARLAPAAERLQHAMASVKERDLGVCLFSPDPYLAIGPEQALFDFTSEDCVRYYHARVRDAYQHYPMADRILLDGPEWGYELRPAHPGTRTVFHDFDDRPSVRQKAAALGYDFGRMCRSIQRLEGTLGRLTADGLRRFLAAQRGALDGVDLLLVDRRLWDWFAFRHEVMQRFLAGLRSVAKTLHPALQLGLGPRLPTWARLTGCSLKTVAPVTDFQAPKVYLWKGGFDGYAGTLQRDAEYLLAANPGLPEDLCLEALFRVLGIELPGVRTMADFRNEFSSSYFDLTLANELRKIRADVASLEQVVPYVEVGAHPHGGEPISPAQFERIVATLQREGLTRFIHYWHGAFDEEVRVVRSFTR